MLFTGANLFAQDRTVSGQVTDSDTDDPIPGVNILIQGTTQGTVTDIDGNYELSIPSDGVILMYSYVGYKSQTIDIGTRSTVNIALIADVTALSEIVVTGYGTQEKKEITSAVASVKEKDFNQGNINDAAELLQGRVAGLSITRNNAGNPNGDYTVRLRGMSTIGANVQPLVVIDGIIGGDLNNVDPKDIASIDVLKDGSAAAIYGTRGSSGVVIVTTKSGKEGQFNVDLNAYWVVETIYREQNILDATEWRQLSSEINAGIDYGSETDWYDEITQTANTQVYNLSMSGGSKNTTYRASINYRDAAGTLLNTGFQRLNARLNLTQKAMNDRLALTFLTSGTFNRSEYGFDDAWRYATIYNPTAPVRDSGEEFEKWGGYYQNVLFDYYNPVAILEQNTSDGSDSRVNMAIRGAYEIIDGLTVDAFYSIQATEELRNQYYGKESFWQGADRNGNARKESRQRWNQLFETTANWNTDFGRTNMTLLGGYSYQEFWHEGFFARGGDFVTDFFQYNNMGAAKEFNDGLGEVDSWKDNAKLIAFFGRVNFNIDETYFVSASVRQEGSSRFGTGNKWGTFPAASAGVELANFIGSSSVDNLKFRVSWGITGNIPGESYLSLLRLGPGSSFFYNGEFIPSYSPISNANPDLKWETKTEWNFGFDFSFFGSKLFGALDYYIRDTQDLLYEFGVPQPPNLYNQAWVNVGELKTSGIELALTWAAVERANFSYSTTITPTVYIQNDLVSLSGEFNGATLEFGTQTLGAMGAPGMSAVPLQRVAEGEPLGQIWTQVYEGIGPNGDLLLSDTNGDGTIDELDRMVTGSGIPDFEFGWANNFTFARNWDLNIFFRGVFGHDLLNKYRAFYEVPQGIGSYNTFEGAFDLKNPETGAYMNSSSGLLSSYHVESADFFSLDNLSLGYNFNMDNSGAFRNIRLYIGANNLFIITGYKGPDPNPRYTDDNDDPLVTGIDYRNRWILTRSFNIGATFGF
jgi:iron complex outermembrane receptor protein